MTHSIAVDFGGTNIRAAYFPTPDPAPTEQVKIPTQADTGPDRVIDRLITSIEEVMPANAAGISVGIGSPGPLDPDEGIIYKAPNLQGWIDIPLKARLEDRLNCKVLLGNDANVAALGEWKHGAGKGTAHLIYLTISTGIGGGVIIDNQLLLGSRGLAGELGHISLERDGAKCGCGQRGHAEALASGTAIARNANEALHAGAQSVLREAYQEQGEVTSKAVGLAAQDGDPFALGLVTDAGVLIGHLLADLAHAFNPEIFVFGGGVSQLGELLFNPVRESFESHVMDPAYSEKVRIEPAALGDDAGLVGAMVLATQG
jgi:glucokinase